MNNSILVGVGALLIGGVGGYIAGNSGAPGDGGPPKVAKATVPSKGMRSGGGSSSGAIRSSKTGNFEDIMKTPGQTARLQSLMEYYAGLDPALFGEEAAKLEDLPFTERLIASYFLFARWAEIDPQEALAYTGEMGRAGFMVRGTVLQSWASSDPAGAAKYYQENPREFGMMGGFGGRGTGAAGQIASEWAKQDPDGALTWAQGLEGRDASSAIGSIFRQVAQDDPSKAAGMAAALSDEERGGAYRSIAREWAQQDWSAAEAWISGLPGEERDAAMAQAIRGLASDDPVAASQKISSLPAGEDKSDAIRSIAENWAREDAGAAAAWLVAEGGENVGRSIRDVMGNWVGQDKTAALEFVNSQPEGDLRDSAASSYVFSNRDGDVQESLKVAESIANEETRARTVGMTAMRWMQDDKDAAVQYIESTGSLSDEAKTRIIERAEGGGGRDRGDRGGRGGGRGGR